MVLEGCVCEACGRSQILQEFHESSFEGHGGWQLYFKEWSSPFIGALWVLTSRATTSDARNVISSSH